MSKRTKSDTSVSHTNTVKQIIESAQATWKTILKLQAADGINPDGVFVTDDRYGSVHPQKQAHSYVLGYHHLMANKTYWIKAGDLWQDELELENGEPYEVEVPVQTDIDLGDDEVTLADVETTTETISLENLAHRWAFRYVRVHRVIESSYGASERRTERKRIWLPPRAIAKAFEQLEEVRSKIKLAADIETPDWNADKVLDPSDGVRDPYDHEV